MSEIDSFLNDKPGTVAGPSSINDFLADAPKPSKGFLGHARDLGLSAVKSAVAVPELAVGLGDIASGGKVGKFLENEGGSVGFRPKQAKEYLSSLQTDQLNAQRQEFSDADGIVDKFGVAMQNPSLVGNTVVESLAPMLAGGLVGRGVKAAGLAKTGAAAGAIGEGAVMAGSAAEQIRQQTEDGLLTGKQTALALGTGAVGALVGVAGNKLANRLGFGEADSMLVDGLGRAAHTAAAPPARGAAARIFGGGAIEGAEELGQSVPEQMAQNEALSRPLDEGVADAAVMGTLAGAAMGAGAGVARGFGDRAAVTPPPGAQPPATPPAAPAPPAGTPGAQPPSVPPVAGAGAPGVPPTTGTPGPQQAPPAGTAPATPPAPAPGMPAGAGTASFADILDTDSVYSTWSNIQDGTDRATMRDQMDYAAKNYSGVATNENRDELVKELSTQFKWFRAATPEQKKTATDLLISQAAPSASPATDPLVAADQQRAKRLATVGVTDPAPNSPLTNAAIVAVDSGAHDLAVGAQQATAGANASGQASMQGQPRAQQAQAAGTGTVRTSNPAPADVLPNQAPQSDDQPLDTNLQASSGVVQSFAGTPQTPGAPISPVQPAPSQTVSPSSSPVESQIVAPNQAGYKVQGVDEAIQRGASSITVSRDGQPAPFNTFVLSVQGDVAEVASVERASDSQGGVRGSGFAAYVALGNELAARGVTLTNGDRQNAPGAKLWAQLKQAGYAQRQASGKGLEFVARAAPQAQAAPAPAPSPQDAIAALSAEITSGLDAATGKPLTGMQPGMRKAKMRQLIAQLPAGEIEAARAKYDPPTPAMRGEQPANITGAQIDKEWSAFAPESGTLNVPRADMPQIKAEHRGAMVNFLKARGIESQSDEVPAASLKPTQAEFSPEKVAKAKGFGGPDRSILVSSDGHVLDGHHQWMAKREDGAPVKVIRLGASISQLLPIVKEFPSAQQSAGAQPQGAQSEPQANQTVPQQAQQEASPATTAVASPANEVAPDSAASTAQVTGNITPAAAAPATAAGELPPAPRPTTWRKNAIQAGAVARSLGIDTKGMKPPEVVAAVERTDAAIESGSDHIGVNNQPLAEGGKPFKFRRDARQAQKLNPTMRVISAGNEFVLTKKTPAQLAQRYSRVVQTSPRGEPIPAHAFIAGKGGLAASARSELRIGVNPRVGMGHLFAGKGRAGLTLDQAAEYLIEDGYLPANASPSDAAALIKRSLSSPQYTPDGVTQMAEREDEARRAAYMQQDEPQQDASAQQQAQTPQDGQADDWMDDYSAAYQDTLAEGQMLDDNEFAASDDSGIPFDQDEGVMLTGDAAMRAMGFTEQEIQETNDEIASRQRIAPADSQVREGAIEAVTSSAREADGQRAPEARPTGEVTQEVASAPAAPEAAIKTSDKPSFNPPSDTPSSPGVYKMREGTFARFDHGIWWRAMPTARKALLTEFAGADQMRPENRYSEEFAWTPYAEIYRRAFDGEPSAMRLVNEAKNPAVPSPTPDASPGAPAAESTPARPARWRENYIQAAAVARQLGIVTKKGVKLAELVAEIDRKDAGAQEAAKHKDGRTIPQLGDKVFTYARGMFGSKAGLNGEVANGKNGKIVRITASGGMLGESASRSAVPLTDDWTLMGEEHAADRISRESRERIEREGKAISDGREAALKDGAARNGTLDASTVRLGDVLERPDGALVVVGEIGKDGALFGYPLDEPDEAPRGMGADMRGTRLRTDVKVPSNGKHLIRDGDVTKAKFADGYRAVEFDFDLGEYKPVNTDTLTAPTPQQIIDQQDRAEAAAQAEKSQQRAADERARRERERKDIARASEAAADTFTLGGDAEQNLSGQVSVFDEPAAPAPKAEAAPADDLDAMFDDIMAETAPAAPPTPAKVRAAPAKPRTTPAKAPRTATQAAGGAAKNAAAALANAIDGLGALFGAKSKGRIGSGLSFDEDTYARAKPLFIQAVSNLKDAAADIREAMRAVISMVSAKFGRETTENMKPYIVRFAADVRDGKISQEELNAASTDGRVERDSAEPAAEPAVGDSVPANARGTAATTDGTGGQASTEAGRGQQDRAGVPFGSAPVAGERGDQPVSTGNPTPELAGILAGSDFREPGGDSGIAGVPPESIPASEVDAVADASNAGLKAGIERARADKIPVKPGDINNIRATLPQLLEGQQEDVLKAEQRFAKPDGYGMLFTNGTGTGKTFTGLGIVKRFARQGKTNTLIAVPDDKIAADWIESARVLGLTITKLENSKDAGVGIVVTSYANLGMNDALATRKWDLVVADEAHTLMQDKDGTPTTYLHNLRAITGHPDGVYQRHTMLNRDKIEALREISAEITNNNTIMSKDDTMDAMIQSLQVANARLIPRRDSLRRELDDAASAVKQEVKERQGAGRTRLAALSATPFAWEKTIDWANGYLFDYKEGYPFNESSTVRNQPSPREYYFQTRLGYRMRYNKLNAPDAQVDSSLMQRQFNSELKKAGALSGRMLDVKPDYDRRFVLVESAIGNRIDEALAWLNERRQKAVKDDLGFSNLAGAINEKFQYLQKRYLLEAIKATEAVPIVKAHMALGRKVVVFHDYKQGGGFNPFSLNASGVSSNPDQAETATQFNAALAEFNDEFADLVNYPFVKMGSPVDVFQREIPGVLIINGDENKNEIPKRYKRFQDESTGPLVMLVQSAKNKGWSGHDTTGKNQRVLINIGQPTAPTLAVQQEGRIYRTGQASDAIVRYLNTGTNWERWTFASTIATRAGTAENLGMGEQARALKDSFVQSFEESDTYAPGHEGEGKGGKERDKAANNVLTEYDRARALYFANQKKTSRTKAQEGADYFATPEPLGLKMVEWLDARSDEDVLEPSGGHGAIARWFPEKTKKTVIEPSLALRSRLALAMDVKEDRIIDGTFEDHAVVNKYDGIAMNPPFGTAGRTAVDHIAKAAQHLRDGGRLVALLPVGSADAKFDKWLNGESEVSARHLAIHPTLGKIYPGDTLKMSGFGDDFKIVAHAIDGPASGPQFVRAKGTPKDRGINLVAVKVIEPTGERTKVGRTTDSLHIIADIKLPSVTFERAGTAVNTRIVVIEKQTDEKLAPASASRSLDLTSIESIKELFDRLENIALPKRPKVDAVEEAPARAEKPAKTAKPMAELGATVTLDGKPYKVTTYTTNAGKVLRGAWLPTKPMAERFGSTFQKRGEGWFVRESNFPDQAATQSAPAPAFSRSTATAPGMPPAQVQAIADRISAGWANAPKIVVATSMADPRIPQAARDEDQRQRAMGATGSPEGFVHDGVIYLLADQLTSPARAAEVLMHEALGHIGLQGVFGDSLKSILQQVATMRRADVAKKAEQYGLDLNNPADRLIAAEEVLADMAASRPELGFVKRAIAAVRNWLRANIPGFNNLKLTDNDIIAAYLLPARGFIERGAAGRNGGSAAFSRGAADQTDTPAFKKWFGESKVVDAEGKPLAVYHGTNHSFDAFTDDKKSGKTGNPNAQLGFFFTDSSGEASSYASNWGKDGGNVMPAFLAIRNPYQMPYKEFNDLAVAAYRGLEDMRITGKVTDAQAERIRAAREGAQAGALARQAELMADGYDGVITEVDGVREFIAFNPEQIKSAIGNNGDFNPANPDIRFSRSPADIIGDAVDRARDAVNAMAGRNDARAADMGDLTDSQRALLGKIGASSTPTADAIRAATDRAGLKIRQGIVDRYASLKELDERTLGADFLSTSITDSSWVLAKMASAAGGALNSMMTVGRIKYNAGQKVIEMQGEPDGGLTAVLKKLGPPAEVERFFGWVAANRASKLLGEGRENLFTPDEIAAGMSMNTGNTEAGQARAALYATAFNDFQKYRDDVLAVAEAAGIISEENRAMWRDEFYVPFYRVMDEDAKNGGPGGGLSRQEAFKRLKGGKQNLNDLMENTLMNFHHLLGASLKNQAAAQAMKNAERSGLARKVPESRRDTKTSTFVLEGGKKVFYQVDDALVFESLTALSDPGLNSAAVQVMSAFKRVFTQLTTVTPQFVIANTFRDLLQASSTSPTSKNIAKNLAQGIKSYRDEKTRAEMLASGGAFSFGHIYGMDAEEVRASLRKTVAGAELISSPSMIPGILRKGWAAWSDVTDTSENISRAATYAQNVEQLGKLRAAFEARDVMDFSQHGAWPAVRFLIRVVPFLNARLQGLDKLYRSGIKPSILTAMGKGTDTDRQAAARFAMVTGALTMATMALYLLNADDDEYQKLEEWQKDTYWFFRIGGNAFFLPKPFEVGAIATLAERTLQQAVDDKATGMLFAERLKQMLMQTFAFSPVPQMFQPAIDVYSNRDAFTGRDIESAGMERLSPGLRARDTTTAPARALSAATRVLGDNTKIAISPVQADHLIKGYLGGVGASAAAMLDTMHRAATGQESPDKRFVEYQPIRRFYRDLDIPATSTRYSTLFYEGLKEANRVYADVQELQKLGRAEDANELTAKRRNVLQMRVALNAQQRRLTDINNRLKEVRRSDRDGAWKRRELDLLNTQRALITERMGKMIEDERASR